jgi:hypothetical protein
MNEKSAESSIDAPQHSSGVAFPEKITIRWVSDHVPISWFWYSLVGLIPIAGLVFAAGMETKAWLLSHSTPTTSQTLCTNEDSRRLTASQSQCQEKDKQLSDANLKILELKNSQSDLKSLPSDIQIIENQRKQIDSCQANIADIRKDLLKKQTGHFSPFTNGATIKRKLIRREAEQLIDIIDNITSVARAAQHVNFPGGLMINPFPHRFNDNSFPYSLNSSGVDNAITQILKLKSDITDIESKIRFIRENNINFEQEIIDIIGNTSIHDVIAISDSYINKLNRIKSEQCVNGLLYYSYLNDEASKLGTASTHFSAWASSLLRERAMTVRKEIEAFL